jgi:HEAT repeat protein
MPPLMCPDASILYENLDSVKGGGSLGERRYAADALADLGIAASKAVQPLAKTLDSKDKGLVVSSLRALSSIGPEAGSASQSIAAKLKHSDPKVRAYAAHALGKIGKASAAHSKALVALTTDSDAKVRKEAVKALNSIGLSTKELLPVFIKVLEDSDPSVSIQAINAVTEIGKPAVSELVKSLSSKKAQYWAVLILSSIGPDAAEAVPGLTKLLDSDEPEMVLQVALALAKIGPSAKSASGKLIELAKDKEISHQYAAVYALGQIGAKEAEELISKSSKSKDSLLKLISVWALAKLDPSDKKKMQAAVDIIMKNVKSRDGSLRRAAATALVELDAPRELTRPLIVDLIALEDEDVIHAVIDAVAIHGKEAVPKLIVALEDSNVNEFAIKVVQAIGPEAKETSPVISKLLKIQSSDRFTIDLLFAIAAIGEGAAETTTDILPYIKSKDQDVRMAACHALARIGPKANSANASLTKLLDHHDAYTRNIAAWALTKINPEDTDILKNAVPFLTEVLRIGNRRGKIEAALALGEMGELAGSAVPELKMLISRTRDVTVKNLASEAVKKIEK